MPSELPRSSTSICLVVFAMHTGDWNFPSYAGSACKTNTSHKVLRLPIGGVEDLMSEFGFAVDLKARALTGYAWTGQQSPLSL